MISTKPSRACLVPETLDQFHIPFIPLDHANWSGQYPYKPTVKFRRVWEDSCCEFFLQPFEDGPYYNFECNAAGKMYIACGMTREGRKQVAAIHYHNVKRWTSFGRKTFKEKNGRQTWEVALIIPLDVMTSHHLRHPRGMTMRANFYKCGDKLAKPHFLSWNPVDCDHPDFHRPSSFGKITFV